MLGDVRGKSNISLRFHRNALPVKCAPLFAATAENSSISQAELPDEGWGVLIYLRQEVQMVPVDMTHAVLARVKLESATLE